MHVPPSTGCEPPPPNPNRRRRCRTADAALRTTWTRSSAMSDGPPHQVECVATSHAQVYSQLWQRLRSVSEHELDWPIHVQANTVRWILSHLLFIEVWTADMLEGSGTYETNRDPKVYEREELGTLRDRYETAFARTQRNLRSVTAADLGRDVDMLGVMTVPLLRVLENHVHHFAGHMYQIRLIRGTYSRQHGTDKAAFDEW
jgi:uncharacterized damage-inducible protein DinB